MENIMVTVSMGAYNHEKFVRQALDSVLMQEVNFKYEIVITDDASTDSTADIIKEYADKYPDMIHACLRKENIGATENGIYRKSVSKGKYLAHLECDDFWNVPDKLQKQVDFLENNPDYSLCFTDVKVIYDSTRIIPYMRKDINSLNEYLLDGKGLMEIPTATCMYRNIFSKHSEYFEYYRSNKLIGDRITHTLFLTLGKFKYLPICSATYRYITKKGNSFSSMSVITRLTSTVKCYRFCMDISPKDTHDAWKKIMAATQKRLINAIVKEKGVNAGLLYFFNDMTLSEKYYLYKEQWK